MYTLMKLSSYLKRKEEETKERKGNHGAEQQHGLRSGLEEPPARLIRFHVPDTNEYVLFSFFCIYAITYLGLAQSWK